MLANILLTQLLSSPQLNPLDAPNFPPYTRPGIPPELNLITYRPQNSIAHRIVSAITKPNWVMNEGTLFFWFLERPEGPLGALGRFPWRDAFLQ